MLLCPHMPEGTPKPRRNESLEGSEVQHQFVAELMARSGISEEEMAAIIAEPELMDTIAEKMRDVAARATSPAAQEKRQQFREAQMFNEEYPVERVFGIAREIKTATGDVTPAQLVEKCGESRTLERYLNQTTSNIARKYRKAFEAARDDREFNA